MANESTERIVFMVTRTIVALALAALAGYCVLKGIAYFALPRAEAEKISFEVLGLKLGASGLALPGQFLGRVVRP